MLRSKIGMYYTFKSESDMLKVANELEVEGFKVKREYDSCFENYKVTVLGYK